MSATTSYAPTSTPYPVHVDAGDQPAVSRWLWLVKWFLAIPHYVVLVFLWTAFVVLSVVAFFSILATGRYPRAIFDFNVGVLRWWWRVTYYSYGALATDRYPPFTLAEDPSYPAHLEIEYPAHLSRGLVLVKWWLLAIPHYLIVGILVGGGTTVAWQADGDARWASGLGLVGLLALVAAVMVASTGAYPRPLYDLLLGLNRWVLRVAAYAGLMTDQYPPFRLDQGPHEPDGHVGLKTTGGPTTGAPTTSVSTSGALATTGASGRRGWAAGSVLTVVLGCLVALMSLGLFAGGAATLVANETARDADGYVMSRTESVESTGHAVLFSDLKIHTTGASWVPRQLIGDVKVTISPTDPGAPTFFGIGAVGEVDAFLSGASHSVERGPQLTPLEVQGVRTPEPPEAAAFWDASVVGSGDQEVVWSPLDGDWSAVVMNPDGGAGVSADVAVGATFPLLFRFGVSLLLTALVLAAVSALMVTLAMRHAGRWLR